MESGTPRADTTTMQKPKAPAARKHQAELGGRGVSAKQWELAGSGRDEVVDAEGVRRDTCWGRTDGKADERVRFRGSGLPDRRSAGQRSWAPVVWLDGTVEADRRWSSGAVVDRLLGGQTEVIEDGPCGVQIGDGCDDGTRAAAGRTEEDIEPRRRGPGAWPRPSAGSCSKVAGPPWSSAWVRPRRPEQKERGKHPGRPILTSGARCGIVSA
jgi:hypothetical protein